MYCDYLGQNAAMLSKNPRMLMQLKNLNRLTPEQRQAIATQAQTHRTRLRAQEKAPQA